MSSTSCKFFFFIDKEATKLVFYGTHVAQAKAKRDRQTDRRMDKAIPLWRYPLLVQQRVTEARYFHLF